MTNANLRYFTTVARHGSIREAAGELHVAQSALSRQIQKLEQDLGVPLFQRHARGVELTSAGEIYLRHARSSLRQDERVRSELDALKGLRRGTVNLQAIESLVPGVLPQVILGFTARHPGITFNVTVDRSDRIVAAVRDGRTDIGIAFYPTLERELTSVFKMREPLVALMSPRHPLAGKARVSLAESVAFPIALPLRNSGSRLLIDIACKAAGIYMLPVLETNSIQLRVQFVHVNHGITFHSRLSAADSLSTGDVIAVPIRDRLVNSATIEVITHASRQLSLAGEAFLRFLQGALQNLREPLSSAA